MASLLDSDSLRWLKRLHLRVTGRVRGGLRGERRSATKGSGGEFIDTRPYAAGDDLRHLDWHLYARLDQLLIRIYEAPRDHTLHILLDESPSMAVDDKIWFARRLAAALGYLTLSSGDRVTVTKFSDAVISRVGPLRSVRKAPELLRFLDEDAPQGGGTDLLPAAQSVAARRHPGTVVLISDLMGENREETLRVLAAARLRAAVLHVLSPQERMPALGGEVTLIDSETQEQFTTRIDARMQRAYVDRLNAFTAGIRATCTGYGFAFIDIGTDVSMEQLLIGDLRKGGLVR